MKSGESKRLLVVGIGNEAMKDDGLGVRLVRELGKRCWPDGIRLAILGPDPLDLLLMDDEPDGMVFLDAVSSGALAGTIHRLRVEEAFPPGIGAPSSVHHLGLRETLGLAKAMGGLTATVLGVECGAIGPGQELTAQLTAMLPDIVESVAGEITNIYQAMSVSPKTVC